MGFLAPWFLAGLVTLGVPIFVHLLRKHVSTPRPVSSLMFFERGTQSSTKHRRLRYLLLFALRSLIVLLIVLAFANPFLRRRADANQSLLLIVLDNSFSMRSGTHFADAKAQALQLLASKPGSQRAQVIALDGQSQILSEPTQDTNQLKTAIDSIQVGDGHASFADLARSIRTLTESNSEPMDLHLFSDVQRSAMPESFSEAILPPAVKLTLHPVAKDSAAPNWTIEGLTAPADLTDPRDPAVSRVKAVLTGFATPEVEKTVSLVVNGNIVSSKKLKVAANGRTPVEFSPINVEYGFNRCEIRIDDDDALSADNAARFVVRRTDPQRVLFVHNGADQRSATYFAAALNAANRGAYILQAINAEQSTDIDPTKFAFTVLADAANLPSIFEHTLGQYVSKGGNLLIALGLNAERQTHIPLWNGSIHGSHNFVASGAASVGQVDFTFPAMEQQQPGRENGGWSSTKIWYATSVDPAGARVAASLNDGTPLLLDRRVSEGHVLLFTSGFDGITNDLPLQPVFVAFVDKASRYLSGGEQLSGSRIVDSFIQLRSSPATSDQTAGVEVIDPDGGRPLTLNEARTAQTFRLTRAGFYQLRFANGRDAVVGVNPDRRESDLTPITPEMRNLWTASNADPASAQRAATSEIRYRPLSLWWYFMLLVLTVAVAEAFFSTRYLKTDREEI
jgi:hypothetical protein